jgi:preprotein translocase subunit SecY
MIIVAGIIAGFPDMFTSLFTQYISGIDGAVTNYVDWITFAIITIVFLLIIFFVTVVNSAQRKIPIQYSNRPATAQFKGQHDSNIPMKINSAGVIPVIFAVTLLSIPSTIAGIFGGASPTWVTELFTYTRPAGYALYVLLIFVFALFYSFVQINPDKIAKNLQNQKAYIPGVRPGVETENYISRSLFKITLIGGIYLVIIASMPILMAVIFPDMPAAVSIGGTSLLIVVGVAIETTKQIKTQTMEQNYSGFIK